MHRRLIAALGTVLIFLPVLLWSRGDRSAETAAVKLPKALGTIRVGSANQLAWLDLASGDLTPLTPASSYLRFALSPDGRSILHTAMPDQPGEQAGNDGSHTDLLKLPADGKGKAEKLCRFP